MAEHLLSTHVTLSLSQRNTQHTQTDTHTPRSTRIHTHTFTGHHRHALTPQNVIRLYKYVI